MFIQVEIEVIGEGGIEVEDSQLVEVVDAAKNAQAASDDSALALLADITSKYQQGEPTLQVIKKDEIEEVYRHTSKLILMLINNKFGILVCVVMSVFVVSRKLCIMRKP